MNRGDGNRNRKEQQIGDQPGTPLVRCLVLVAKILNLRETKKTHGGSTGAEQAGGQRSMQHRAAGGAGMHSNQRRAQGRPDTGGSSACMACRKHRKSEAGGAASVQKRKKGPRAGGTDFWAQRK